MNRITDNTFIKNIVSYKLKGKKIWKTKGFFKEMEKMKTPNPWRYLTLWLYELKGGKTAAKVLEAYTNSCEYINFKMEIIIEINSSLGGIYLYKLNHVR